MMNLRKHFDRAWVAAEARNLVPGVLGKPTSATTWDVAAAGRANHVYVRVSVAGGESVTIARNLNRVPNRANLHVRMKLEIGGTYTIMDLDPAYYSEATTADVTNPFDTPNHTHAIGTGLNYEMEAQRLQPGRVYPAGGWFVTINPFRYYHAGAWQTYEGADLTLGVNKPTTAGYKRWVVVCVNPATNTAIAVNGSDALYAATFAIQDIDAISIAAYIPLCAIIMRQDDTSINAIAAYYDAKGWLNRSATLLTELGDTNITSPADGALLTYQTSSSKWIDQVPAVGLSFSDAEGDPAAVTGTAADGMSAYAARRDHVHSGSAYSLTTHTHTGDLESISLITDWNHRNVNRSGSAYAWKGNEFTPDMTIILYALGFYGTVVANGVYKGAVMTATGSPPSAVNAVTFSSSVTMGASPANLDGMCFWLEFGTPVTLTAGTIYGLMLGRTDSTDTYILPVPFNGGVAAETAVQMPGLSHGRAWRIAKANPVSTDTIDRITTDSVGMGYRYRISGSAW